MAVGRQLDSLSICSSFLWVQKSPPSCAERCSRSWPPSLQWSSWCRCSSAAAWPSSTVSVGGNDTSLQDPQTSGDRWRRADPPNRHRSSLETLEQSFKQAFIKGHIFRRSSGNIIYVWENMRINLMGTNVHFLVSMATFGNNFTTVRSYVGCIMGSPWIDTVTLSKSWLLGSFHVSKFHWETLPRPYLSVINHEQSTTENTLCRSRVTQYKFSLKVCFSLHEFNGSFCGMLCDITLASITLLCKNKYFLNFSEQTEQNYFKNFWPMPAS